LSGAAGSSVAPGSSAAPGSTEASGAVESGRPGSSPKLVDTRSWQLQQIAALGYSIDLPPDFERVTDDPSQPVPAFAVIAKANPDEAYNLQIVAQRLASSAGVFGDLGIWSVRPTSLAQVGVLAGLPYRIGVADLQVQVKQSVSSRASPLDPTSIDAVEMPAGVGFLTRYRAATDLADHREVHLRTPNGRYLIVAMTMPGTIDNALEAEFLAICGSLAPVAGTTSGDTPAPSTGPSGHVDATLEQLLPDAVGGVTLVKRSLNGEDVVGSSVQTGGTVLDALGTLVSAPGSVTLAFGVPADASTGGSSGLLVAAYRIAGLGPGAIDGLLATFPTQVWSHQAIGGRDALVSVAASDKSRTYLRVSGDVLEQVQTSDAALAATALGAMQ